jgi:hypothetical protein
MKSPNYCILQCKSLAADPMGFKETKSFMGRLDRSFTTERLWTNVFRNVQTPFYGIDKISMLEILHGTDR